MITKTFSTVIFILFFGVAAFSQGVHVGLKAGTDIHKMSGKSFDEEFKFGYHVGGFVTIKIKNIGIQPEVYFSQVNARTGTNPNTVIPGGSSSFKNIKLSYLNIPILLNVKFSKNVDFQLGPQYGILVDQNNILSSGKEAFKSGDFSINGGLQVKVSKFRIYGRYNIGLSNLNDATDTEKWKSQAIHVGLGYAIF